MILSLVLLTIFSATPAISFAQAAETTPATPQRLCQSWHVRSAFPENVYAGTSETSAVIGRVVPDTILCVYGISEENPLWLEINPDGPDAIEEIVGYILQEELRVGTPGTIANPNIYCDAWQVSRNATINVRSCPGTACGVVTTRDPNDIVCVSNYQFSGGNWSQVTHPATSQSGFVRTSQLTYVYDESIGCPDNSHQVLNQTSLYSCADARCITDFSIPAGTRLCVSSDSYEGGTWVEITEGNDPVGWILIDLLTPLDSDVTLETVSLTQDVNFANDSVPIENNTDTTEQQPTPEPTQISIGNNAQVAQASTATATPLDGTVNPTPIPGTGVNAPICPVGTDPIVAGQCVTVTPDVSVIPTQEGNGLLLAQNVSFSSLFVENLELVSPQGNLEFFFVLPDDWAVEGPVTLVLDVDYSESITSFSDEVNLENANLSSRLDIRLDGVLAASLNLNDDDVGRRQVEVVLPVELLQDQTTRFHSIRLELNARDYCEINAETRILINAETSYMRAVYQEVIPILDLGRYPIPFYNSPIGLEEESVYIVLPDNPDDSHLQTAASIAAGLGILTSNDLRLNALFASQMTDAIYRNNNLILIGEPSRNTLIQDLYNTRALPSSLGSDGNIVVGGLSLAANEGLIQLAPNPQNRAKTILVATALSQLGLQRAGRALAGSPSLMGIRGEVAVITDAIEIFHADNPGDDLPIGTYRLTDFEIEENIVLVGAGQKAFNFNFDLPIGGDLREDAYIELMFNATNSINLESSSFNVLINEVPISGVALSDVIKQEETIEEGLGPETIEVDFNRIRIAIPQGVVEPGRENDVTLLVDMRGDWGCDLPEFIWSTISRDSIMYLPQEGLSPDDYFPYVSLFPIPFNRFPNLQDVWISLPAEVDAVDLEQLLRTMSVLGDATDLAEGIIPVINRGEFPAGTNLGDYHFIVLGRPTENAFLADLNSDLPQQFFPGSDELVQEFDDITYRYPDGLNIGVLQTMISPWNDRRVVFVITGTSELGQEYAGTAIFDLTFGTGPLEGDIVYVSAVDANPIDSRFVYDENQIIDLLADTLDFVTPTLTPSMTPIVVAETPTGTIAPEIVDAEATALATGIFTESPDLITSTPVPTPRPPFDATIEAPPERPAWLTYALVVLGGAVIIVAIYGGIRALRSQNEEDE